MFNLLHSILPAKAKSKEVVILLSEGPPGSEKFKMAEGLSGTDAAGGPSASQPSPSIAWLYLPWWCWRVAARVLELREKSGRDG